MIEEIRYHHRTRNYAMEQRKRADLSLLSFLRIQLGWSRSLPDAERKRIAEEAKALVTNPTDEWAPVIAASLAARAPFDAVEKAAAKEMERLAKQLPVWDAWAKDTRGCGARSLAVIVGEAGDLSNYPKKGHLWKRMGVAVVGDVRQGGLSKNAPAAAWIEHGYNRQRRSRMWTIGDSMLKAQGPYREIYLARKDYERQQAEAAGLTVAPSAKIPKARAAEFMSDGHIHRRAQRYMEKQFLRDLWVAWRRAVQEMSDRTRPRVPADILDAFDADMQATYDKIVEGSEGHGHVADKACGRMPDSPQRFALTE
jgi:hypothetical protein